ncbi:MAG TPA: GntG family PLP-dependent aldolase [Frankiaceae bacterium]|jgi:threonine aldolase|nr:GntG family PLP-dependent aldolase [Frankiaceae bacterium]
MGFSSGLIDLRSDTVTAPTEGMRRAMAAAEVGDDVYGEDPSVIALQERVAAMFGHEAAVFVPSGTMGNQICLRLVVPPAGELLCDADAHIVTYEGGGAAQHGGIQTRTVPGPALDVDAYAAQLRAPGWGALPTSAVAVEQTHNRGGGLVHSFEQLAELRRRTRQTAALHCDGARIWNASIATGVPLHEYGALFDTLSVCLSKGLGAPVGSLVATSAARAEEARIIRRRLGGGMRQAGILAAAGSYALDHHLDRLAEDHAHARLLAEACGVDPKSVDSNIVLTFVRDAPGFVAAAQAEGVLVSAVAPDRVRLVTSLAVDPAAAQRAAAVFSKLPHN